jgi:hypothetical protein
LLGTSPCRDPDLTSEPDLLVGRAQGACAEDSCFQKRGGIAREGGGDANQGVELFALGLEGRIDLRPGKRAVDEASHRGGGIAPCLETRFDGQAHAANAGAGLVGSGYERGRARLAAGGD